MVDGVEGEVSLMCVFVVPKGSKITFTTETFGLAFYCGQRKVCAASPAEDW